MGSKQNKEKRVIHNLDGSTSHTHCCLPGALFTKHPNGIMELTIDPRYAPKTQVQSDSHANHHKKTTRHR